jgi:hypothetical protein
MTTPFDRSYVIAAGIIAAGLLVLVLLLQDFGGRLPNLPRFEPPAAQVGLGPTNNRVKELFLPAALAGVKPATNLQPPFVTTYFQPKPPPPPPVILTRKVNLIYDGLFVTASGEKRAYVVVDGTMGLFKVGAPVVNDLMISNMDRLVLTLKRAATQEVIVPFRTSKEVEIPLP